MGATPTHGAPRSHAFLSGGVLHIVTIFFLDHLTSPPSARALNVIPGRVIVWGTRPGMGSGIVVGGGAIDVAPTLTPTVGHHAPDPLPSPGLGRYKLLRI
jgi:hypothetical protein